MLPGLPPGTLFHLIVTDLWLSVNQKVDDQPEGSPWVAPRQARTAQEEKGSTDYRLPRVLCTWINPTEIDAHHKTTQESRKATKTNWL